MSQIEYLAKIAEEKKPIEVLRNEVKNFLLLKQRDEATEALVNYFMRDNYVYAVRSDDKKELWIYENGIYTENGISYISEFVREVLGASYTAQLKNLVVEKIEADNYISANDFFDFQDNLDFIPVQNGLLNIKTRKLEDFDPSKIFFVKLPVVFDKKAKCPKIKQFIADICGDASDITTIQQYIGTCLLRDNRLEKMLMCIGGGRNGKSKLAELIKCFLGAESVAGLQPSMFEDPENFQTYLLHGKLVNMNMDISKQAFKNTTLLKSLSGRETITVPRKFKTPLTFKNSCKFIFGANNLPMSYDISNGFWERWILINLPYTFVYKDRLERIEPKLRHKFKIRYDDIIDQIATPQELSGMLNWALDGLSKVLDNNGFDYKYTEEEVKSLWVRESDSFAAFFMDVCEYNHGSKVTKQDLLRAYSEYCREHGLRLLTPKKIAYFMSEQGIFDARIRAEGEDDYVWENLRYKEMYRGATDARNIESYQKPSVSDKIKSYVQRQKQPRLQDMYMQFDKDVIDKMLRDGELIQINSDQVAMRI